MHSPSSKSYHFLLLLLLLLSYLPFPQTTCTLLTFCSPSGNYTSGTQFETNLKHLLSSLATSNISHSGGFYTNTVGETPNQVYGLAQYTRTPLQPFQERNTCLDTASKEIIQRCPNAKQAIIRYDNCFLRYSNQSFFSILDSNVKIYYWVTQNVSDPNRFKRVLGDMMDGLSEQAAFDPSKLMFAANVTRFNDFQNLYGMVWCSRDLSENDCYRCLGSLIGFIPSCCEGQEGGQIVAVSCNIRFEFYPFYELSTYAPPSLSPPPSVVVSPSPPSVVVSPSPPLPQSASSKKKRNTSTMIIAIVVPVFVAMMLVFSIYGYMSRRKAGYVRHKTRSTESILFDLDIVRTATGNFCVENQLGVGGFGPVYKGTLPDGQEIAVKRLSMNSGQGVEQFMNELLTLAKLQHRNLVRLLGCCLEGQEKLLMYEYVPNKSLDNFLFDPIKRSQLNWEIRCKIIEGIARGLLYLHEDSRLRIIHRDLKASNVLLDLEMNPKISDFGLAKLFGGEQSHGSTRRIAGTYGYMAPEYVIHGKFSIKSDVFSFGVLLLEIITGQKNSGFNQTGQAQDLLSYTWIHWRGGTALEVVDQDLRKAFPPASEVLRIIHIGLLCVQKDAVDRPIMSSVILMLGNNSITLRAPSPPFFVASRAGLDALSGTSASTSTESDTTSRPMHVSNNEMSITELEPR